MPYRNKILVTGASGTVGTALMERLIEDGYDVVGADIVPNRWSKAVDERTVQVDLRNPAELTALPTDVDTVVHLAANARVRALVAEPDRARDNFEMTYNVLEYARENDISRVLFSSSREVYGDGNGVVRGEDETTIDDCESPYTASKVGGEAMTEAYARCYDFDAAIVRFSNVYGRYDISDRVVPLFIAQADQNHDMAVYGRNKVLDFTHIDDCVDGVVSAIENFESAAGMTFNIASGEGVSLLTLANRVSELVQSDAAVDTESSKVGEVSRFVADISKARAVLGYEPQKSPLGGLKEAVDWYQQNDRIERVIEPEVAAESGEPHTTGQASSETRADGGETGVAKHSPSDSQSTGGSATDTR